MQDTMLYLCKNIQGCVFGYTQSDEITLVLIDYQTLNTSAWFDYEVQKMCSISASMATLEFNRAFHRNVEEWRDNTMLGIFSAMRGVLDSGEPIDKDTQLLLNSNSSYNGMLIKAEESGAMFDSRCFNIPKEEVANMIYWRQNDAIKNSISTVAQYYFSTKELHGKSSTDKIHMLIDEHGVDWNSFPIEQQRGSACIKTEHGWEVEHQMPLIKGDDRLYVESVIYIDNKEDSE
jgi:tRNA(His) 5'-end guanylyltransferase